MQILIAILLGIKRNWHIFFGLIAGIVVGILLPASHYPLVHKILDIIGQSFINIIQMVVIPLVISAIVIGISSIGDNKQLAKFGKKMIFYYAIITVAAVVIGAVLALVMKPGLGAQSFISPDIASEMQGYVSAAIAEQQSNMAGMFLGLIPKNPFHSLSTGDMVPIIIFVLIFSIALAKIGEINRPVVSFFESIFAATMKVTDWIMYLAAPGVFALTAASVSSFGVSMFEGVWKYLLVLALGFLIQFFFFFLSVLISNPGKNRVSALCDTQIRKRQIFFNRHMRRCSFHRILKQSPDLNRPAILGHIGDLFLIKIHTSLVYIETAADAVK